MDQTPLPFKPEYPYGKTYACKGDKTVWVSPDNTVGRLLHEPFFLAGDSAVDRCQERATSEPRETERETHSLHRVDVSGNSLSIGCISRPWAPSLTHRRPPACRSRHAANFSQPVNGRLQQCRWRYGAAVSNWLFGRDRHRDAEGWNEIPWST